jgi:DNA-binding response OmpR family regulator
MRILHVEDSADLAELVEITFHGLGFRGTLDHAETVAQARAKLDGGAEYDLVITDMSLPDGTGLDVVRDVREHPLGLRVPIIVLSGETSGGNIARAYALGANSYVPKLVRGRATLDVIRSLYSHWVQDAILPGNLAGLDLLLSRMRVMRSRLASFYVQLADQFEPDQQFWLSRAMASSNIANLVAFLERHVDTRGMPIPAELERKLAEIQLRDAQSIAAIERDVARGAIKTPEDARARLVQIVSLGIDREDIYAPVASDLFPLSRVAMQTLLETIASTLDAVAAFLEPTLRADDADTRHKVEAMRAEASKVRALAAQGRTPASEPSAERHA